MAALGALALAGCGGGGSHDVASGPTITVDNPAGAPLARTQMIAQADAICRRRNDAIDAVRLSGSGGPAIARFASQSATLEQAALIELSRLNPPAAMAGDWRHVVSFDRVLLEDIVRLEVYGKRNDKRLIPALARSVEAVKRELLALGKRDGLTDCSRIR